ncbi:MAG: hypothetical protein RL651_1012 [Pseudomonadota bacterium]|jgi:uncharacterized membrane-anchored protein
MNQARMPEIYPDRLRLNDELHARPPVGLWPNEHILYLALVNTSGKRLQEEVIIRDLCDSLGGDSCPTLQGNNIEFDVAVNSDVCQGAPEGLRFRVKYERHGEFSSWWFFQQTESSDLSQPAEFCFNLDKWLHRLPGQVLVALNIRVCHMQQIPAMHEMAARFNQNTLIGSEVAHGAGAAFTDFRIDGNGRSKLVFLNKSMGSRQAGRILQALVEIETYRMMALLSLPEVQESFPVLGQQEKALIEVSKLLATPAESLLTEQSRDLELQQRISGISSAIEALSSRTQFRLSASEAYFQLVQRRITDLQEINISGIQGFGEFMERRLVPAMKTCSTFSLRIRETSHRVSRISQLLQTRVEIAREEQNSKLLASMEERSKHQLHLQQAVEGLSIVAISYYGIGLASYVFKAMKTMGILHDVELATGIATPLVLLAVAMMTRKIRNSFRKA